MADQFAISKQLAGNQKATYIKQNKQELFQFINANYQKIANSAVDSSLSIELLAEILDSKNIEKFIQKISQIVKALLTKGYNKNSQDANGLLQQLFVGFCQLNNPKESLDFFADLLFLTEQSLYSPIKTYVVYFSYQCKDYSRIESILSTFTSLINIDSFMSNDDHSVLYFYKGLIHLRRKEFERAFASFSICVKPVELLRGLVMNNIQMNAIKFIILMSYMPSMEKYINFNHFVLSRMNRFANLRELECYGELFNRKEINYETWVAQNEKKLKQDKALGLAKIVVKEIEFNHIQTVLKKYKTLHLETLVKMLQMGKEDILSYLKAKTISSELNIRYDEVTGVIEIRPVSYCNPNMFTNLKKNYEMLTQENSNMLQSSLSLMEFNKTMLFSKMRDYKMHD